MSDSLTFSLIQSNLIWENKQENLSAFENKIKSLPAEKEIVVLPETFTTGFSMNPQKLSEKMDGATLQWMKRIAAENRIILTGSYIIEDEEKYYNRLIWMQPNKEYGYYDKKHLFSYSGEDKDFSQGNKKFIAQVKGWKICTQICYDLRFPVWNRQTKDMRYDVLLFVANWPERRIHAWKTLLQARAIENQCYVIAVNRVGKDGNDIEYNGLSCIINPLGEIMQSIEGKEDVLTVTLHKSELEEVRNKFRFYDDADEFVIIDKQ